MKALSILILIFAAVAIVAIICRQLFTSIADDCLMQEETEKYEKKAKIAFYVLVGSTAIVAICGLVQTIIPLLK